jgi:hypothetical protein
MTEQLVEKRIMEQIETALTLSGVEGVKVYGAWQPAAEGAVKAIESGDALGIVSVNVSPREYATPTVPHAALATTISLSMRFEADPTGSKRLAVADAISQLLFSWQDSFAAFKAAFADIDGLAVCGFTLSGGAVGTNRSAALWTYSHNLTINAIFAKKG